MNPPELQENYDRLFAQVSQFQHGDAEAAVPVLDSWREFLEGWVLLLRGGPVNRLTWSHRIFLSNFVKNSGLARALKSRHPMSAAYTAAETALTTVSIQIRPWDTEDLRQEVTEVFLAVLKRYRSRNDQNYLIPYIQKAFPYALTRRVQSLIKDPLVNLASDKIIPILEFEDGSSTQNVRSHTARRAIPLKDLARLTVSYEENVANLGEDTLDAGWLRGDYCHEVFEDLTYSERKLILDFYHYQKTDAQIAQGLGVSYNTAIRRRHFIEAKLRGEYQAPTCQYCQIEIPKAPLGRQPRQCGGCRELRRLERQVRRKARRRDVLSPVQECLSHVG